MIPPVFTIIKNTPEVTALLGISPTRFYPWGEAPQNVEKPYATYGVYNGLPENYLTNTPDVDNLGTQIDIWSTTATACQNCFVAIRNALESHGHMTSFRVADRDEETKLYHAIMEFDFWESR